MAWWEGAWHCGRGNDIVSGGVTGWVGAWNGGKRHYIVGGGLI